MQWLIRNTYKVIAADNTLSDHDFYFLDSALSEAGNLADLTFHASKFQTFTGVPVRHCSSHEQLFQMIKSTFLTGEGCMVACNTKAEVDYLHQRLLDETPELDKQKRIRVYTSDTSSSTNIAQDVQYWDSCLIMFSPKLRTGIDFHPKKPLNVFYSGCGDTTVDPAGAVQMMTRCRKIKAVYIYTTKMRKNPRFKTREAMDEHLDMQQNCFKALTCKHTNMEDSSTLAELCDRDWSTEKLVDVYSET